MHQHIKKLWVDALRSGSYQQGRNHLRRGDTYCCLGVLCDLHDQSQNRTGWSKDDELPLCTYLGCDVLLPPTVRKWAAITRRTLDTPFFLTDVSVESKLSLMNDRGASFDEIADFIEQNL
jgi:hypothetical protein